MADFDPARITEAVEKIEPNVLQPLVRKAADDFYGYVMEAAQDYLRDNMDFNLKAHLEMLERENARMRRELYEIGEIIGPPWSTHAEKLGRLRELDCASADLTKLRYEAAFAPTHPSGDDKQC